MPFDECNYDDGGGGGPTPHDNELMALVARRSLELFSSECDFAEVCEFHTGLVVLAMMTTGMSNTMEAHPNNPSALSMCEQMIGTLTRCAKHLEEEKVKWKTR